MEWRELRRTALIYNLEVLNRRDSNRIGFLVNLHSGGMMLISNEPQEATGPLDLRVRLPRNVMKNENVDLRGEIRWSRKTNENVHYIGIRFLEVSDESNAILNKLTKQFKLEANPDELLNDPYLHQADIDELN